MREQQGKYTYERSYVYVVPNEIFISVDEFFQKNFLKFEASLLAPVVIYDVFSTRIFWKSYRA